MQNKNLVQEQVDHGMTRIDEFGNSSEETRAAAIKAMGMLALALAIDKLADRLPKVINTGQ